MKKAILLSIGTSYEVHLLIDGIFLEKWMLNEVQLGLQASNVCAAHNIEFCVDYVRECMLI